MERVRSVLEEHWSARPALVGINHIFNIERNVLEPLGLTFVIWVIFSADDAERYADQILEFLARRTSVALPTSSFALDRISDIQELRDTPNPHKIILCDAAIEKIQRITSPIPSSPFNYQTHAAVNSLALTLLILAITPGAPDSTTYLFGCDGAVRNEVRQIYYDQENMELGRRVLAEKSIYQDMVAFDACWGALVEQYLINRGLAAPRVLNTNPESCYKSFPKIALSEVSISSVPLPFPVREVPEATARALAFELLQEVKRAGSTFTHATTNPERIWDRVGENGRTGARTVVRILEAGSTNLQERLAAALVSHAVLAKRFKELQQELTQQTSELLDTRKAVQDCVAERTKIAEDLEFRAVDLMEARPLLVERTNLLVRRTEQLEDCVADRAGIADDLVTRTADLLEVRQLLVERTNLLAGRTEQLEDSLAGWARIAEERGTGTEDRFG